MADESLAAEVVLVPSGNCRTSLTNYRVVCVVMWDP